MAGPVGIGNSALTIEQLHRERSLQMKRLIDGWSDRISDARIMPGDIGEYIRERIKQHQEMIEALQWFASHLALDKPDNHIVSEVLMRGLQGLVEDEKRSRIEVERKMEAMAQMDMYSNKPSIPTPWK